jgi:ABC-type uncharacterized transport system involved in gliding motility auxiliary subunit
MKTIATRKKYWQYLFWLGPALVLMGLSAGVVSGKWEPVPLGLLISGIVLIGLWLLFQARESNWWGRRSTQAGTNALVATLAVLLILGWLTSWQSAILCGWTSQKLSYLPLHLNRVS